VLERSHQTGNQWLTPVIPATQETAIRRITVQSQPRQIVLETLSQKKKKSQKIKRGGVADGMAQGIGPEFNSPYHTHTHRYKWVDCVQVWWCTPVIPTCGRLRQEDGEFQASLGDITRPYSKTKLIN
jgi:hypothetical protein